MKGLHSVFSGHWGHEPGPAGSGAAVPAACASVSPATNSGARRTSGRRDACPTVASESTVRRRLARPVFGLAALLWTFTSCGPATSPNEAAVESRLFNRVRVIGTRGAGLGEFNKPRSVAVDSQDNLYVVDMTGRVQKFSSEGTFLSFWQMPQTDKGKPKGMCRDEKGDIVVLEPHYSRVNHFTPGGKLVAQWGAPGTNSGELAFPRSVVMNSRGDVFVSEYGLTERVQQFTARGGKLIRVLGRGGTGDGEFNRAEGLGIDLQDRLYVADSCNHRIQIFSPEGKFLSAYGKAGTGRGEMSYPYDVKVDAQGLQFVCEFGNSRIQIFDRNHQPVEILGGPGVAPGQFNNPWGMALDSKGSLYVADAMNHRVQKFIRRTEVADDEKGRAGRRARVSSQLSVVSVASDQWIVNRVSLSTNYQQPATSNWQLTTDN